MQMDFRVDTDTWFVFSILFISAFSVLIVAFIAIPYYLRKKQLRRIKYKISRKNNLYQQLQQKQSENELIELENSNIALKANLIKDLNDFLKTGSGTQHIPGFFLEFEKAYPNFNPTLLKLFPGITEYELKLCSLIRMKLTAKEISTFMNITPDSVNKARYRLRKKMALKTNESLDLFLVKI